MLYVHEKIRFVFSFSLERKERGWGKENRKRWRLKRKANRKRKARKLHKGNKKMSPWSEMGARGSNLQGEGQWESLQDLGKVKAGFVQAENGRSCSGLTAGTSPSCSPYFHTLLLHTFAMLEHSISLWLALANRIWANMMQAEAWQGFVRISWLAPVPSHCYEHLLGFACWWM